MMAMRATPFRTVGLRGTLVHRPVLPRRRICYASPPEAPVPPPGPNDTKDRKLDTLLEELKRSGLDKSRAKAVLKKWQELGVDDPEQLRKLLIKRSIRPAAIIGFQALLDAVACFGGFYVAGVIADNDPFPGQLPLQLLADFFGMYYVIQVFLNLSVIGVLLLTAYKYGTNSKEVLLAVQQMAGPSTGLTVIDKAQVAVNTLKVLQTLDEIALLLKELSAYNTSRGTLQNLSAYLTLSRAKQTGFEPEKYGLTEKEAGEIAYVFSIYDINDDSRLELSELNRLCQGLGKELDEAETKEAMRILDTSKNGFVEFDEFVAWWTKDRSKAAASA